jgi:hypothetical protein
MIYEKSPERASFFDGGKEKYKITIPPSVSKYL